MTDASGTDPTGSGVEPKGTSRTNQLLGYAVFALVVVLLTGFLYVVYTGLLAPQAPRTAAERDLAYLQGMTQNAPSAPEGWAAYAQRLIDTQQYAEADRVIHVGLSKVATDSPILVQQARLLALQSQPDQAISILAKALDHIDKDRAALALALAKRGITGTTVPIERDVAIEAAILKARLLVGQAKFKDALAAFDRALSEDPTMSDMLTLRGETHLKLGEKDKARKDFQAALQYSPDFAPAKADLSKLGTETSK